MVLQRSLILMLLVFLAGCDRNPLLPRYDLDGSAMGTTFSVAVIAPPENIDLEALQDEIVHELERVEQIASTYREDSELSQLNNGSSASVSMELCRMIAAAQAVSMETGGAFDISVGELVNAWGFGPLEETDLPPPAEVI